MIPDHMKMVVDSDSPEFIAPLANMKSILDTHLTNNYSLDEPLEEFRGNARGGRFRCNTTQRQQKPYIIAETSTPLAGSCLGIMMSDHDLLRACTAMDIPVHRETPKFLVDKPLEVRMYTPELIALYTCSREVTLMMGKLAAELIKFEGDFLEMTSPDFEKAEPTPLVMSMDTTSSPLLFRWLCELRSTGIRLQAQTLRTQRLFWLGNHTTGANWDTVEQLLFS